MDATATPSVTDESEAQAAPVAESTPAPADELLIEEISIDGMCGVY